MNSVYRQSEPVRIVTVLFVACLTIACIAA